MTLTSDLKAYREAHGLTLLEMARQLDISVNALGKIEDGDLSGPRAHEYALTVRRLIDQPSVVRQCASCGADNPADTGRYPGCPADRDTDTAALARMLADEQAAHTETQQRLADVRAERNAWQNLATQRQTETEAALARSPLIETLSINQGEMTATIRSEAVQALANILAGWFDDHGGVNYVEVQLTNKELGPLLMTVQRLDGKTPHQLRTEAEQRMAKIRELASTLWLYLPLSKRDKLAALLKEPECET